MRAPPRFPPFFPPAPLSRWGDEPVPPLSPRVAVRAAEHSLPAGLVAELDAHLRQRGAVDRLDDVLEELTAIRRDRKSTRLNSSHANISYAVFCLKKKKNKIGREKRAFRLRMTLKLHSMQLPGKESASAVRTGLVSIRR